MKGINAYAIVAMIVFLSGCSEVAAPFSGTLAITLTPAESTIDVGEEVMLTVGVKSARNLFAVSFDIAFDSKIVVVDSVYAVPSGILGPEAIISQIQPRPGMMCVGIGRTQTSADDCVSGTGDLVRVRFRARVAGSTRVVVPRVMIVDEDGRQNSELDECQLNEATIVVQKGR